LAGFASEAVELMYVLHNLISLKSYIWSPQVVFNAVAIFWVTSGLRPHTPSMEHQHSAPELDDVVFTGLSISLPRTIRTVHLTCPPAESNPPAAAQVQVLSSPSFIDILAPNEVLSWIRYIPHQRNDVCEGFFTT
jgi:hypothetical protein